MKLLAAFSFSVALSPTVVLAQDYVLKSIKIDHPFARATPPGAKTGGVFFTVENRGDTADTLIRASSPITQPTNACERSTIGPASSYVRATLPAWNLRARS